MELQPTLCLPKDHILVDVLPAVSIHGHFAGSSTRRSALTEIKKDDMTDMRY